MQFDSSMSQGKQTLKLLQMHCNCNLEKIISQWEQKLISLEVNSICDFIQFMFKRVNINTVRRKF